MKILVYGAGNIGSLYAARLRDSGHDVIMLARGKRLHDIRERGILLEEFHTGKQTTTHVECVEQLRPEDVYDLVLVVLPRHVVSHVLPTLAKNNRTPSVMFFGNNAAGADAMIQALGRERVLLGFPGAAAVPLDDYIRYLILSPREQPTTIGEVNGVRSNRIDAIANALRTAGFPVSICANMDAWLCGLRPFVTPLSIRRCGNSPRQYHSQRVRQLSDGEPSRLVLANAKTLLERKSAR